MKAVPAGPRDSRRHLRMLSILAALAILPGAGHAATVVWARDGASIVLTKYNRGWMPRPTWKIFTGSGNAVALIGLKLPDQQTCAVIRPWAFRLQVKKGGETRWLESSGIWLHDGPARYDRWKQSLGGPLIIEPLDDDPAPDGWIRLHLIVPRLPEHERWQIVAVEINDNAWEVKACESE